MSNFSKTIELEMREVAIESLKFAQPTMSGVRVGVALLAENKEGYKKVFAGCNIEISAGCQANIHAERLALLKAISEGYITPLKCVITSNTEVHKAAMCGYCMQDYSYLNLECDIEVIHEATRKVIVNPTVRQRQGEFGYFSERKLQ